MMKKLKFYGFIILLCCTTWLMTAVTDVSVVTDLVIISGTFWNEELPEEPTGVDFTLFAAEIKPASGSAVSHAETMTGEVSEGPDTIVVSTAENMTAVDGDLYLAAMATKNVTQVLSVTGLGLTWVRVDSQAGWRSQTYAELWKAHGTTTGDGHVTATVTDFQAGNNVAMTVSRYSGVDASDPLGTVISVNAYGIDGDWTGGIYGEDPMEYFVDIEITSSESVVYAAMAHRNRIHIPEETFNVRADVLASTAGRAASVMVMDNGTPTSVEENSLSVPKEFVLFQNYPNPFNPETTIEYHLARSGKVKIVIFNLMGLEVVTLYNGIQNRGTHLVKWNGLDEKGRAVPSGLYIYCLEASDITKSAKMMLLR